MSSFKKTSLAQTSWKVVPLSIVGYLIQYVFHMYLANLLSPGDYGDLAVALSVAIFWSFVSELGSSKTIPKYIPQYQKSKDLQRMSGLLRSYFYFTVTLGFLIAVITTFVAVFGFPVFRKAGVTDYHPLILALWFLPLMSLSKVARSLLKTYHVFILSDIPQKIALYSLLILLVWFFVSFGVEVSDWLTVLLFGCAYLVVIFTYALLVHNYIPPFYITHKPEYEMRDWLSTSIPIMVSLTIIVAIKQIDLIMVELIGGTEAKVGYFSAADQTAQILIIAYTSLSIIFASYIGEALIQGRTQTKKILLKMVKLTSIFCVPIFLLLIFAGKWILGLFGEDYIHAYSTMIILAIGFATSAILSCSITYLQFSGRQVHVLVVQIITLCIDVVLNFALIPTIGILGAGIASATAMITMSVWLGISAWVKLNRSK